jgi:replication initiation and membrane attachment protein DnaB
MKKTHIPQPQNVRKIQGSFAWIDHRLMRDGYLPIMTHEDLGLYLFLILAADRNGVSFYRKEKICDTLSLSFQQFEIARDRLIDLNLIAYQSYSVMSPNGFYQVLPIRTPAPNLAQKVLQKVSEQWANA